VALHFNARAIIRFTLNPVGDVPSQCASHASRLNLTSDADFVTIVILLGCSNTEAQEGTTPDISQKLVP
jgi:hypothetical protein